MNGASAGTEPTRKMSGMNISSPAASNPNPYNTPTTTSNANATAANAASNNTVPSALPSTPPKCASPNCIGNMPVYSAASMRPNTTASAIINVMNVTDMIFAHTPCEVAAAWRARPHQPLGVGGGALMDAPTDALMVEP